MGWLSPMKTANKKASSPSRGGSWHVVTDGGGGCKALGRADFFPTITPIPNRYTTSLKHPQSPNGDSSLQRKEPCGGMPYGDSLRPATSVGVQLTNRGLYLLRLTTAGR